MKRIFLVLFVLINMCTIAQSTNFKLQEDKFYKVESLILGDIVLPFEAEIAYFKWGGRIHYYFLSRRWQR